MDGSLGDLVPARVGCGCSTWGVLSLGLRLWTGLGASNLEADPLSKGVGGSGAGAEEGMSPHHPNGICAYYRQKKKVVTSVLPYAADEMVVQRMAQIRWSAYLHSCPTILIEFAQMLEGFASTRGLVLGPTHRSKERRV